MARIPAFLIGFILLGYEVPAKSAESFRLDLEMPEFRERVKVLSAVDLGVGESGYISGYNQVFCRSSDGTVQLLGQTELTEPSEYGHHWNITIQGDHSASLTYQIGTKQTDPDTDLVWSLMAMYYAELCEAFLDRTRVNFGSLIPISSINGLTKISALAEDIATYRLGPAAIPAGDDPLKQARQELDEARWNEGGIEREDPWLLQEWESAKDGSPVVSLIAGSRETEPGDSTRVYTNLGIMCEHQELTVAIGRPEFVYAPGLIWVSFKVGNEKAKSQSWSNTKYKGLGLWKSEEAISFVQELLDEDRLSISFRVDEKEPVRVTFEIHKLREMLEPLAEACNWEVSGS